MATTELTSALYAVIGTRVREARRLVGLSQESLATAVGVTRTSISNLEKGRQFVPLAQIYAIARVLGRSVPDLLPDREVVEATLPQVDATISGTVRPISQHQLQKTLLSVASGDMMTGGSDA